MLGRGLDHHVVAEVGIAERSATNDRVDPGRVIAVPGADRSPWAASDVEKPRQDRGSTIIDFVGLSKHGLALAMNRVGLATDNRAKSASSLSVVLRFKRRF